MVTFYSYVTNYQRVSLGLIEQPIFPGTSPSTHPPSLSVTRMVGSLNRTDLGILGCLPLYDYCIYAMHCHNQNFTTRNGRNWKVGSPYGGFLSHGGTHPGV